MFSLVLTDGTEDLVLNFKIKRTVIAQKWFKELKENYPLYETDRFTNWGSNNLIDDLNKHIDIVNKYDNIIDKKVDTNIKQKDLNYLHKFFEDLRGEILKETSWYKASPKKVKSSVQRINVLIHFSILNSKLYQLSSRVDHLRFSTLLSSLFLLM